MNTNLITYQHKKLQKKKSIFRDFLKQYELQSMIWPGIIFLFIFSIIPLTGILIAFKDYSISGGIQGIISAPWVGFKYFKQFFTDDNFIYVLRNTLSMNLLYLFFGFPVPIIFALLLNELTSKRLKKITQTISYLPHFISWAVFGGIVMAILSSDGLANAILLKLGLIHQSIDFMQKPNYFWGIVIVSGIIKSVGYSSILYVASISSVEQEMYESAEMDGAGRFRVMWSITLPCISGTIVIMLLLFLSSMLTSSFDQIWMLQNNLNIPTSETIDTYVYKLGISRMRFSYATAVGLFQSFVGMTLLFFGNFMARRFGDKGLF